MLLIRFMLPHNPKAGLSHTKGYAYEAYHCTSVGINKGLSRTSFRMVLYSLVLNPQQEEFPPSPVSGAGICKQKLLSPRVTGQIPTRGDYTSRVLTSTVTEPGTAMYQANRSG